jgi:hypothetical protein
MDREGKITVTPKLVKEDMDTKEENDSGCDHVTLEVVEEYYEEFTIARIHYEWVADSKEAQDGYTSRSNENRKGPRAIAIQSGEGETKFCKIKKKKYSSKECPCFCLSIKKVCSLLSISNFLFIETRH